MGGKGVREGITFYFLGPMYTVNPTRALDVGMPEATMPTQRNKA